MISEYILFVFYILSSKKGRFIHFKLLKISIDLPSELYSIIKNWAFFNVDILLRAISRGIDIKAVEIASAKIGSSETTLIDKFLLLLELFDKGSIIWDLILFFRRKLLL